MSRCRIQGLVLAAVLAATVPSASRPCTGCASPRGTSTPSTRPSGQTRSARGPSSRASPSCRGCASSAGSRRFARLPSSPPRTIVLAGMNQQRLAFLTTEDFRALDGAVSGRQPARRSHEVGLRGGTGRTTGRTSLPPDPEAGKAGPPRTRTRRRREGDKKPADAKADAVAPKLPLRMAGADVPPKGAHVRRPEAPMGNRRRHPQDGDLRQGGRPRRRGPAVPAEVPSMEKRRVLRHAGRKCSGARSTATSGSR